MTSKEESKEDNSLTEATTELKEKDESTKKSPNAKSKDTSKKKENAEEEEEEIEVEEEDEDEEDVEEEEKKGDDSNPITLPEKTKDGLEVSMELIKKFKDISVEESDEGICDFILEKGLPMDVKDENTLALILYFHKLCVSFFKILNSLKKKNIEKIFLSSLKESYFLFADESIKHFNYKSLAKKIF